VPEVVAAAEYLGPGTRLSSVLVTEELTGMLPLHEAIPQAARDLPADIFRSLKKGLAWEMARLSRLLHDRRCFHKDLYLCHFYVRETDLRNPPADWRGRVVMIDLHRLARHRFTYWIWQVKDLAQLLYSSEVEGVTPRDRLEFWRAYRSLGENAKSLRLIGALVRAKYRRYAEHNRKLKLKKGQTAHPAPRRETVDKAA
jgi:heptose I phosphotransferase